MRIVDNDLPHSLMHFLIQYMGNQGVQLYVDEDDEEFDEEDAIAMRLDSEDEDDDDDEYDLDEDDEDVMNSDQVDHDGAVDQDDQHADMDA